jgi:hypothetical protein
MSWSWLKNKKPELNTPSERIRVVINPSKGLVNRLKRNVTMMSVRATGSKMTRPVMK